MANDFTGDARCKALWRFENGALATDSISTNDLTLINSAVVDLVNFREGAAALKVDVNGGTWRYAKIENTDLAAGFPLKVGDTTKKITVCGWVKPTSLSNSHVPFVFGTYPTSPFGMYYSSTWGELRPIYNGNLQDANINVTAGYWYHFALAVNGATGTLYLRVYNSYNGVVSTFSLSGLGAITVANVPLCIGAGSAGWGCGDVAPTDEIVVFNDVLAAAEIDNIRLGCFGFTYVGQVPLTLTPQSLGTGPIVYQGHALLRLTPIATTSLFDPGVPDVIPASTGGWAMGGAGVWGGSTPTTTDLSEFEDLDPTGFYMGGGSEVISTVPTAEAIAAEVAFVFCGPGATGNAATSEPAQDVIEADGGFVMGGAGVWGQVAPGGIPSVALVGSGGFILSGSGFTLAPGVTPPTTVIVSTGGFVLGRSGLPPIEVTYPASLDRVIEETAAFEMGGAGAWGGSTPGTTIIVSQGAIFVLSGAGGLATVKSPPIVVITGDATGGFVLGGSGWAADAEVFEAWVLSGQAFEPSVFSGFNFNSFAVKGGQAYACGDAGIYLLGADHDAGETIHTGARVGPINFGADRDKRIRGIQFGQGGKKTRVRVKSENGDVGVFEPDRDENRVVVSRDIQGRQFIIDFMDFEELSQCEIMPLRLARR